MVKDINLDKDIIFARLKECRGKVDRVVFTTKEPTLNPELGEYVKYAKQIGHARIGVISNGRMCASLSYCLSLIQQGMNMFIISIHGHNAPLHDSLTQSSGSFSQTLRGVKNLSDIKSTFFLVLWASVVLNKLNYRHVYDILKLLSRFDLDVIVLNVVQPRGEKMSKSFLSLMPRYTDIAEEFTKLHELKGIRKLTGAEIKLLGMPPCVARREMAAFFGYTEVIKRISHDGNIEDINCAFVKETKSLKRGKCAECLLFSRCEGVPRAYVEQFGWSEFKPLRDDKSKN